MNKPLRFAAPLALGIAAALSSVVGARGQDSTMAYSSDTLTITRNGRSVLVRSAPDSVTIVVFPDADVAQPVKLDARYVRGGWYRATSLRGVLPRGVEVTRIPWHPLRLTIGPSRAIDVGAGDIVVIRYPQDYRVAGWLRRIS